jgi:hypothetical protein
LIFKFLYGLPQNLRIKAIKFGAKTKKFNTDNIKTFKEIYRDIENNYTVLRDIDNLVQEQGITELLTGFKNLDPDFIDNRLPTKTAIHKEKPPRQQRRKPKPILPFIRATATSETSKQITSKDIDEITEGLNRLHILQVVTERAFQRNRVADVNQTFTDVNLDEDEEDTIFEVNYKSFLARKRD